MVYVVYICVYKIENDMEIKFGALQPKIASQLKEQGLNFDKDNVNTFQTMSHSISMLHIHCVLTDTEADNARNRLYKKILNHVKKLNK